MGEDLQPGSGESAGSRDRFARAFEDVLDRAAVAPPGERPAKLRKSLGEGLRREGFGALVEDQWRVSESFVGLISKAVIAIGIVAVLVLQLEIESPLVILGVGLLVWTLIEALTLPGPLERRLFGVYVYLGLWVVGGVWELQTYGMTSVAASHVAPLAGGAVIARFVSEPGTLKRVGRTLLDALRKVPLAFPVTMLILFAVMLTAEVWEAAHNQSPAQLAGLAAVAILPQLAVLLMRLVKTIPKDFQEVAEELDKTPRGGTAVAHRDALGGMAFDRLKAILGPRRVKWMDDKARTMLAEAYAGRRFRDETDAICETAKRRVRARIATRLLLTVLGVGLLVFIYVYAIIVLTVEEAAAKKWSVAGPGPLDEWILGLPGAPYVNVAVLLAIVAAAVFLAFVVTAKELVTNLSSDYVHEPAQTMLLFTVAARSLGEAFPAEDEEEEEHAPSATAPAAPEPLGAPG